MNQHQPDPAGPQFAAGAHGTEGERAVQRELGTQERAARFHSDQMCDRLNNAMRKFVSRQEMFFLATAGRNGDCDSTFRAGPPGFVRVLDDRTIAYPEYRGNGVLASLGNIRENPHVGILMMDFGRDRIGLHINGRARQVPDERMRARHPDLPVDPVPGRRPQTWVEVGIDEAYVHCSKHIPLMVKASELGDAAERAWGTDDVKRKGGDFFGAAAEARAARREAAADARPAAAPPAPATSPAALPPFPVVPEPAVPPVPRAPVGYRTPDGGAVLRGPAAAGGPRGAGGHRTVGEPAPGPAGDGQVPVFPRSAKQRLPVRPVRHYRPARPAPGGETAAGAGREPRDGDEVTLFGVVRPDEPGTGDDPHDWFRSAAGSGGPDRPEAVPDPAGAPDPGVWRREAERALERAARPARPDDARRDRPGEADVVAAPAGGDAGFHGWFG